MADVMEHDDSTCTAASIDNASRPRQCSEPRLRVRKPSSKASKRKAKAKSVKSAMPSKDQGDELIRLDSPSEKAMARVAQAYEKLEELLGCFGRREFLNRVGARVAKDRIGASRAVLRAIVEEVAADVGAEIGRDVTQILKLGRKELGRVRRLSNTTRRGAKLRTRVQQHQTRRQSEATQGGATHGDATQAGATPQSHFDMTALCSAIDEKNGTEARSEAEEKHQGM